MLILLGTFALPRGAHAAPERITYESLTHVGLGLLPAAACLYPEPDILHVTTAAGPRALPVAFRPAPPTQRRAARARPQDPLEVFQTILSHRLTPGVSEETSRLWLTLRHTPAHHPAAAGASRVAPIPLPGSALLLAISLVMLARARTVHRRKPLPPPRTARRA